jgi:beta-mannosidase
VWTTDEGVNGVALHAANDRPEPLRATLRIALYRDLQACVDEAQDELQLEPHGAAERTVEGLIGRFVDAAWAYRFGPPAQDLIVASLESGDERELLSQAFRFPAGRPARREAAERLELTATARAAADQSVELTVRSRRLAYGVRIQTPGFIPEDDAFSVEPGGQRLVALYPETPGLDFTGGTVSALNLEGPVRIATQ